MERNISALIGDLLAATEPTPELLEQLGKLLTPQEGELLRAVISFCGTLLTEQFEEVAPVLLRADLQQGILEFRPDDLEELVGWASLLERIGTPAKDQIDNLVEVARRFKPRKLRGWDVFTEIAFRLKPPGLEQYLLDLLAHGVTCNREIASDVRDMGAAAQVAAFDRWKEGGFSDISLLSVIAERTGNTPNSLELAQAAMEALATEKDYLKREDLVRVVGSCGNNASFAAPTLAGLIAKVSRYEEELEFQIATAEVLCDLGAAAAPYFRSIYRIALASFGETALTASAFERNLGPFFCENSEFLLSELARVRNGANSSEEQTLLLLARAFADSVNVQTNEALISILLGENLEGILFAIEALAKRLGSEAFKSTFKDRLQSLASQAGLREDVREKAAAFLQTT